MKKLQIAQSSVAVELLNRGPQAMTTKPDMEAHTMSENPVVEALEVPSHHEKYCPFGLVLADGEKVKRCTCWINEILPLARQQAEAEAALEWFIKLLDIEKTKYGIYFSFSSFSGTVSFQYEEIPAIIKRLIEEKT